MKKVRKKKKHQENNMKLGDLIKDNTGIIPKFDKFEKELNNFCEKHDLDNVKIVFIPYSVRVIVGDNYTWHKEYHDLLCECFGLKLVRYNYSQDEMDVCVTYTYAANDDDVLELDFDSL